MDADLELNRWRADGAIGDDRSPRHQHGCSGAEASGFPGEGEGLVGGTRGGGSNTEGASAGFSDPISGDSYDDGGSLSGAPPRTAFLSRDEVSEDSRLLRQILKESEEEIAASAADRANGGFSGSGAMTKLVGGTDLYRDDVYGGYGDIGTDGSGANLQSLDVDRIIESMELEAGEDDVTGGAASGGGMLSWRSGAVATTTSTTLRRRSFTVDDGGGVVEDRAASLPRDRGGSVGALATGGTVAEATTNADQGAGSSGRIPAMGTPRIAFTPGDSVDLPATELAAEELGLSRANRKSQGARLGVAVQQAAAGDTKGVSGGGDWGLTGALRRAEAAEVRLLRGGNREMISPLQV